MDDQIGCGGWLVCMCDMIYGERSDAVDGWMDWMGIYIWFGTTPTETQKKKNNKKIDKNSD